MNSDEQNTIIQSIPEEPEGIDTTEMSGWGEYPLDAVFVRREPRSVIEVVKRINLGRYILTPDFQRSFVWDPKRQSRLIESCLMRIPLPVFYVAEAKDGRIVVVDGLQRLTTFTKYLNNEFALSKLGDGIEDSPLENPLIGKRFKDLPLNLQERLEDTPLTLYILDAKAPERAKLDIFERVNSGEPLTRQQMRNCLFNGQATKLLKEAADSEIFLKATGGSLDKKSMRDREVINRFCAFRLLGVDKYKADMDDFLARSLEHMNQLNGFELDNLGKAFRRSMENNYILFGKHAFRKSIATDLNSRTVINIALFDVCSVMLADLDPEIIEANYNKLWQIVCSLLSDNQFVESITYSTNGSWQVKTRFERLKKEMLEVN